MVHFSHVVRPVSSPLSFSSRFIFHSTKRTYLAVSNCLLTFLLQWFWEFSSPFFWVCSLFYLFQLASRYQRWGFIYLNFSNFFRRDNISPSDNTQALSQVTGHVTWCPLSHYDCWICPLPDRGISSLVSIFYHLIL